MEVMAGSVDEEGVGRVEGVVIGHGVGRRPSLDIAGRVAVDDVVPDRRVAGADAGSQVDAGAPAIGVVGVDGVVVDAGIRGVIVNLYAALIVPDQVVVGDVPVPAGQYDAMTAPPRLCVIVYLVVADGVVAGIDTIDGVVLVDVDA